MLLYGDYLPVEVIDELCQLIHDNSVIKCKSYTFPVEPFFNIVNNLLAIRRQLGSCHIVLLFFASSLATVSCIVLEVNNQ